MYYANWQVLILLLLTNQSTSSNCPTKEVLNECECEEKPLMLTCYDNHLPYVENNTFEICHFIDVVSNLFWLMNVTCNELRIEGKPSEYLSTFIRKLNFTILELNDVKTSLVYEIFELKSSLVRELKFDSLTIEKFDFKFENFPNLIRINNPGWISLKIKSLATNVFSKLKYIEEINFGGSSIEYLEENSLLFSSNKIVHIDLKGKKIKLKYLARSGLWNANGLKVDLSNNNIEHLDENIFKKFCDNHQIFSIDLKGNPIECELNEIQWIFNYEYSVRTAETFPLKNIYCDKMNDQELRFMNESNFNKSTSYLTTESTMTTSMFSPEPEPDKSTFKEWLILICILLLCLLIIPSVIIFKIK